MKDSTTSMVLVTRSSMPSFDEYTEEIRDLWDSHWLTNMGVKHKQFQAGLREYLGVKNIDLLTNGHMAIEISLQALDLPKGSEVITTPFTFASTTHAIVRNGLEPVFCDINAYDFTIDVTKIESLITDRTSAIVPVHVYGNVCNVEEIQRIADKHGLKVLYDAAHAFGVQYKGNSVAEYGDISCFSFHATKVFNSIEGGAACFKDDVIGGRLYRLKNFGIKNAEEVDGVGANAKMNEFCAAMGICNLRHVNEEIKKRSIVVSRYNKRLGEIDGIKLNPSQKDVTPNYAYFPVVFDPIIFGSDRNEVAAALAENGISGRKYFYPLTNTFDCFHEKYDANQTPVALDISRKVLTLPLYADLALDDVDRICDVIIGKRK